MRLEDIQVDLYTGGGSHMRMTHRPTGIVVSADIGPHDSYFKIRDALYNELERKTDVLFSHQPLPSEA